MKKKIIHALKNPVVAISISALVLIGAAAYAYSHLRARMPESSVLVTRGDITEQASFSGTVISKNHADLSFAASGRIAAVYHIPGEYVGQGSLIAALDTADLEANRIQLEAALAIEQAKLADMAAGTDTQFDRSRLALFNSAEDAYAKADDIIHNYVDSFYSNPESAPDFGVTIQNNGTTLVFGAKSYDEKTKLDSERATIGIMLSSWQLALVTAEADPVAFAVRSKDNLESVRGFLNDLALTTDSFSVPDLSYQPTVDGLKAKISTARSAISSALSSLIAAQNMLPNEGAKAIEQAQVTRAQAAVDGVDAQIAKAQIRAPFSGVLAKNDAHTGELAIPNVPVATVVAAGYTVEVYVSETDIAAITPGTIATITLDAYGSSKPFHGTVATVDTAQTVQNGVGAYRTSITLENSDSAIADGMHATVLVATVTKHDVLLVPSRAIIRRGDLNVVRVQSGTTSEERTVTIGVTDGQSTEILTGLSEGESIISFGN